MTPFYVYSGTGCELDREAAWQYIRDGYLLGPRTVLKKRTKRAQAQLPVLSVGSKDLPSVVQQTLEAAMGHMAGACRSVMFSGGFDSMLIAYLAQRRQARVTAVTVQFEGFNPLTVSESIEAADRMGIALHIVPVTVAEFLSVFEEIAGLTKEPVLDLDLGVVYAALKKYFKLTGTVFISGMGCDQWFGNEALEAKGVDHAVRLDEAMVHEDAHHRAARALGCRFCFPFLSRPMLALSRCILASMKTDKKLLRAMVPVDRIPHRERKREIQVSSLMRRVFIKKYGDRAWPSPVSCRNISSRGERQILRQIILGLWLEKQLP